MVFPGRPLSLGFEPIQVVAVFATFNVFRPVRPTWITKY